LCHKQWVCSSPDKLAFPLQIGLLFISLGNFHRTTQTLFVGRTIIMVGLIRTIVRAAGALVLILGILFWIGIIPGTESFKNPWTNVHMLLGIIVMICLVILGILALTTKRASAGLGVGAIILSLLAVALGVSQTSLLVKPEVHWIVQVLHLLIGLAAIGLAESIGSRLAKKS
jgi:hypothetical protein